MTEIFHFFSTYFVQGQKNPNLFRQLPGKGTIKLTPSLTHLDVLYVEIDLQSCVSLVSITKLTQSLNCRAKFDSFCGEVHSKVLKRMIAMLSNRMVFIFLRITTIQ